MIPSPSVYETAVRAVFSRWTLLRLAVDQGWHDGDGAAVAEDLLERLLALLLSDKKVYQDEVEDLLFDTIESKFNALAEDGSVEEIATLVLKLRGECALGDLVHAQDIISKAQVFQPPPCVDGGGNSGDDMSDDDDEDMTAAPPSQPVVDEDGFQVVSSRRGGRRRS